MPIYVCICDCVYTTIRVSGKTKAKIEALKEYERESLEGVLNKLIALVPDGDDEGKYTDSFRAGLLESLAESKAGKSVPFEQVKKELGI